MQNLYKVIIDLNRTRLECKDFLNLSIIVLTIIWIEPDWNVKDLDCATSGEDEKIWIEPDWNVKMAKANCCNAFLFIWIEPDWNVKKIITPELNQKAEFE